MLSNAKLAVTSTTSEAQVEVGILPTLLERKSLILDRIRLLKPQDNLANFPSQIFQLIDDQGKRDRLLHVLDQEKHKQEEFAERIEGETRSVDQALKLERQTTVGLVAFTELRGKVDNLDRDIDKLKDDSLSRWDVAVTVFMILASIGTMVGVALGIANWIAR